MDKYAQYENLLNIFKSANPKFLKVSEMPYYQIRCEDCNNFLTVISGLYTKNEHKALKHCEEMHGYTISIRYEDGNKFIPVFWLSNAVNHTGYVFRIVNTNIDLIREMLKDEGF